MTLGAIIGFVSGLVVSLEKVFPSMAQNPIVVEINKVLAAVSSFVGLSSNSDQAQK